MRESSNNFEIKSDWLNCKSSDDKLFSFLTSVQHLESILPKDRVHNIHLEDNKLSFSIENIITLQLYIHQSYKGNTETEHSFIEYMSEPFGSYHLCLQVYLKKHQSQIVLTGYLNPFVLSIAKNKLTHLVKRINKELSELVIQ